MDPLAFWRNVSIVVLAIQCLVGVVLALGLTYLLVRLMNAAQGKVEIGTRKLQSFTRKVAVETDRYAQKATAPVVTAQAQAARARASILSLLPGQRARAARRAAPPPPPPPGTIQQ
jgi:hypothetical protein